MITHDRGYQNGDGLILMLGLPTDDNSPTDEFYVMGFTAQPEGVDKLRKAGAIVTFTTEPIGYASPGKKTKKKYADWIERIVRKEK